MSNILNNWRGNLARTSDPTTEDNLVEDNLYPQIRRPVKLASGFQYLRGDALGRIASTGEFTLADIDAEDGSEVILAVLCDPVDTSDGVSSTGAAWITGQFNTRAMRFGGTSVASDFDAYDGERGSIFLREMYPSPTYIDSVLQDDASVVAMDKTWLRIGFAPSDNLDSVTQNVALTTTGIYGSTIFWESSNVEVLTIEGVVTRPASGEFYADVTLTATITKNAVTETKFFTVRVLALP